MADGDRHWARMLAGVAVCSFVVLALISPSSGARQARAHAASGIVPIVTGLYTIDPATAPCSNDNKYLNVKAVIDKSSPDGSFSGFIDYPGSPSARIAGSEQSETGNNGYPLAYMSGGPLGSLKGLVTEADQIDFYPSIPCYPGQYEMSMIQYTSLPSCTDLPQLTAHASRDTVTGDIDVQLTASHLERIGVCGRAHMTVTDPAGGQILARAHQSGTTATASVRLTGGQICEAETVAQVKQSKGLGRAQRTALVPDSLPRIASAHAVRNAQGAVTLTVAVNHLLPVSHCKRLQVMFADSVGSLTIPVSRAHGTSATASVRLPTAQECAVSGQITVVQLPTAHAERTVQVIGTPPAFCQVHEP